MLQITVSIGPRGCSSSDYVELLNCWVDDDALHGGYDVC